MYANMVLDKAGKWVDSLKSKHSRPGNSAISFKLLYTLPITVLW
jgi:hypothetical protein